MSNPKKGKSDPQKPTRENNSGTKKPGGYQLSGSHNRRTQGK